MPSWAWALAFLLALAGLAVLLLALLHVRYRGAWSVAWTGGFSIPGESSLRLEFGFPGFMRAWEWNAPASSESGESSTQSSAAGEESGGTHRDAPASPPQDSFAQAEPVGARPERAAFEAVMRSPQANESPAPDSSFAPAESLAAAESYGRPAGSPATGIARKGSPDPNRRRKALFRFATDAPAWGHVLRYGFRVLRLAHRLLRPRVELAAGHPDPVLLGRLAGHWYAVSPLLPLGDTVMGFRFQDRHPSFRARAEGGFSGLSFLLFGIAAIGTFPFFTLGRRAWHGWRHRELEGWRAWAYRRIQSL